VVCGFVFLLLQLLLFVLYMCPLLCLVVLLLVFAKPEQTNDSYRRVSSGAHLTVDLEQRLLPMVS